MVKFQSIYAWACGFVLSTLFSSKLNSIAVLFLVITVIYGMIKKEMRFTFNPLLLPFVVFYLLYIGSLFFTNDLQVALKYLEYKLVFLLFPIIFTFSLKDKFAFKTFIISTFTLFSISILYLLFSSFYCYLESKEIDCFLGSRFSLFNHPTYLCIYLNFYIVLLYFSKIHGWIRWNLFVYYFLYLFFIVPIFLSLSLAGYISFFLLLIIYFGYLLYKKFKIKGLLISFVVSFISIFFIYSIEKSVKSEVDEVYEIVSKSIKDPKGYIINNKSELSGTEARICMWIASIEIMHENPYGVTSGDVDVFLSNKLKSFEKEDLADKHYNPHNQFLQFGVEFGYFGLVFYLLFLITLFFYCIRKSNYLLLFIIISLFINSLFESVLQRQEGVVFYTLTICLLLVYGNSLKKEI